MTQREAEPRPNDLAAIIIAKTIESVRRTDLFTEEELGRLQDILPAGTARQLEALTALFVEGIDENRNA